MANHTEKLNAHFFLLMLSHEEKLRAERHRMEIRYCAKDLRYLAKGGVRRRENVYSGYNRWE
jgi:hypothetical protein